MAIVQSRGALRTLEQPPGVATVSYASPLNDARSGTYAAIYRTQPAVRTVVSFLARNVADLGLHVFRRISDVDRLRLSDHELAVWMTTPNPAITRYRMVENLMSDMGVYFNAYWLKLRGDPSRMYFVRLPPEDCCVDGWLLPSVIKWTQPDGAVIDLAPRDVVYFNGYDPSNPLMGLSPIETLRQILAEEASANAYRRSYFANASRIEGVIQRPREAPKWTPEQKQAFREQWQQRFAGPGNAGQAPVLEDGMTFKEASYSARDSQFTEARKLTREEVAREYHVPLPMVGILDHATFSNIREQHKNLYQDSLGPWLTMIQEEYERQILPECDDTDRIYCEFNIDQKLRGSFEEQAGALQTLVGRPVLTVNEARGRLNLSSLKNDPTADRVAMPLNTTTTGGPTSGAPPAVSGALLAPDITATWQRQRERLAKVPTERRAMVFGQERERWDRELGGDVDRTCRAHGLPIPIAARESVAIARSINADTHALLAAGEDAFSAAREEGLYGK